MVVVQTHPGGLLRRQAWVPIHHYILFIVVTLGYDPRWALDPLCLITVMDG